MEIEQVSIDALTPHPRNYRGHPEGQLAHLKASLAQYGFAKPVVISRDGVILAGHGMVAAAREAGYREVPCNRLDLRGDDPKAEKFVVLDNEVSRLAEDDDTLLAALIADVQRDSGLEGTGYDDASLDALLGSLDEHAWSGGEDGAIQTGDLLARRWFVGFVVDQGDKDAIGAIIEQNQLPTEKPHETLSRLVVASVVNKC